MLYKVYLTSVFKRQYKYDLAMKWKKDQSSDQQEHQVPWVSSVLYVVCETVCLSKFCLYRTGVRTVGCCVKALVVQKVLIVFFQNSQILLSGTENGVYVFDCEVDVHDLSSVSVILVVAT